MRSQTAISNEGRGGRRYRPYAFTEQGTCILCGRSAKDGARMNVDHIKPLAYNWNLRLAPHNLQTLCANCNHGKGGKTADHRSKQPHR